MERNLAALALTMLAACSEAKPGAAAASKVDASAHLVDRNARLIEGASGSATITYQPRVRLLDRDEVVTALAAVSTDGSTLLFASAGPALRALAAGDVVVVRGLFARKVLAVEVGGVSVAVLTAPASLGEVILNGRIHIDAPVRFSPERADRETSPSRSALDRWLELIEPSAHADGPSERVVDLHDSAKQAGGSPVDIVASGWKTKFAATPATGRLDVSLDLRKEAGGFLGVITAEGYLADFEMSSDIEVSEGVLERLDMSFQRVNGVMNVTWEVGKETPGRFMAPARIKLPGALSIPLYRLLDGFPLFLEVSAAIIIQPAITGGMQYSHGAFRVTYDASEGFKAKVGKIDAEGKVTGGITYVESSNLSALAPMGMVLNFAAPRIELTMDPLKVLGDLQGGGLQQAIDKAASKVDAIGARLAKAIEGTELGERLGGVLPDVTAKKIADAMRSNAAAFIQVVTTSAVTHSGASVITPCTRGDYMLQVTVGASGQALGQDVGRVSKVVLEKKLQRIDPSGTKLCEYEGGGSNDRVE